MGYPKQMYKGSYTSEKLNAEEKVVTDDKQEQAARKKGFIDGHEFFSKPPVEPPSPYENVYAEAMKKHG